jgi:tetratricopeptide (TPR) repeat protein
MRRLSPWKIVGLSLLVVGLEGGAVKPSQPSKARQGAAVRGAAVASPKPAEAVVKRPELSVSKQFEVLKRKWRLGEIDDATMWTKIAALSSRDDLEREDRADISQAQGQLLLEAGYPVLAALHAAQAIKAASDPMDRLMTPSWNILSSVARKHSIQNILELLAQDLDVSKSLPPVFGNDWFFFMGTASDKDGDPRKALDYYARLKLDDRYFLASRYQMAMLHVAADRPEEAERSLREIMNSVAIERSPLPGREKRALLNYSRLALGRIYYQEKKFKESIIAFRLVDRRTPQFYDALFGQSWAFFMTGLPNHALGALHAVESPFYEERFNPEASLLRSIVYYWLCRYEDSRTALAEFMDRYSDDVKDLGEFLDRRNFSDEAAYQLFEDLVSGVSEKSLGVSVGILKSAAGRETMMLARDQFASVLEESRRLRGRGVLGTRQGTERPMDYLERWGGALRKDIGARFLKELRSMKEEFERLYGQGQFLYVELLMSEKEQILGKELHGDNKMANVTTRRDVAVWGKKASMSWAQSDKNEYWRDELGYYIYNVQPQCQKVTR